MIKTPDSIQDNNWDLIIKPKSKLFDLNLKDLWNYKDLLVLFVKRDFIALYKQTILGPIWHFIQPLFTTITYLVIFKNIANISTDGLPAILFYMSGITIWNYFSGCLNSSSNTFVSNASIFGKVYFPRLIIPLSTVISNLIRFGIQFLLLIMVFLYYIIFKGLHVNFGLHLALIPFILIVMAGIGLGLGMIISSLTTKYRDLTVLIGFGVQLLMYATPIIYPLSMLSAKYQRIMSINPLTPLVEGFKLALLNTGIVTLGGLLYSFIFMTITLFLGLLIFSKVERSFMDTV